MEQKEPAGHPVGLYHVQVLNSDEQTVCLKITQPAAQWQSACRVQPPEPLQRGKKKGKRVNCRYPQHTNTTQNNPRYKDIEQEPTLFYKSSNMVSLGFSVLGSRSPWDMGLFSHEENCIPVFLQVRNQLSYSAYQMYKYFQVWKNILVLILKHMLSIQGIDFLQH